MKFLAMTVLCVDIYKGINKECVGGNALNIATQYIRSGAGNVSVLGAIGKDRYGRLIRDYFSKSRIDISHLHEIDGNTASNKVYIDKNGDRYFLPSSWNGGVYDTFRLSEDDWSFVSSHDVIATCAHDPNFLELVLRKPVSSKLVADFLDRRDFENIEKLIPLTDLSFISGNADVIQRLKPLSKKYGVLIVVTHGAGGSTAIYDGIEYFTKAVEVDEVVDTTGCGDAFQAAFCVSWFKNENIAEALQSGALAASKILKHYGGVD